MPRRRRQYRGVETPVEDGLCVAVSDHVHGVCDYLVLVWANDFHVYFTHTKRGLECRLQRELLRRYPWKLSKSSRRELADGSLQVAVVYLAIGGIVGAAFIF